MGHGEEIRSLSPPGMLMDFVLHRGWRTKEWTTKKGTTRGGSRFNKANLHSLLTNPVYIGKVRHKDDIFDGEHQAIIADDMFSRVQKRLSRNGSTGGG